MLVTSWLRSVCRRQSATRRRKTRPTNVPQSVELLEQRTLLSASPVLEGIDDVTLLAGSPLLIPLNASDADGQVLTFTATSDDPLVSTYIPQGNRSMRINVEHFGTMTFELFEDRVDRVTDHIIELAESGAEDYEIEAHMRDLLKKTLRPELLNRIDETIIFHQLTPEDLKAIVAIQLHRLQARLAERDLSLSMTDDATAALAGEGYDPQFGARPLKRIIQQRLENPIATRILAGEISPGDTVEVDYQGGAFKFKRSQPAETVEAEAVEER